MKWPTAPRFAQPSSSSFDASTASRSKFTRVISARNSAIVFRFGGVAGAVSGEVRPACIGASTYKKVEQALTNGSGVFFSPNPKTRMSCARNRITRGVKSASLDTIANASKRPLCSKSIASTTIAMSEAFFPVLSANCCIGWIALGCSACSHFCSVGFFQLPYARRTLAMPCLASSASTTSIFEAGALSASISSAIRIFWSIVFLRDVGR